MLRGRERAVYNGEGLSLHTAHRLLKAYACCTAVLVHSSERQLTRLLVDGPRKFASRSSVAIDALRSGRHPRTHTTLYPGVRGSLGYLKLLGMVCRRLHRSFSYRSSRVEAYKNYGLHHRVTLIIYRAAKFST